MNNLTVFENPEFGPIRTVELDGEPWLVGKDVAAALGYSNTKDALASHVDDEDKRILQRSEIATIENHIPKSVLPVNFVSADVPNRGLTIINESGLYSLVLSSKLPTARKFRRWVTSEVLPSIHKTGGYIAGQKELSPAELMAKALKVANDVLAERDARIAKLDAENVALLAENEAQRQVIADFEPVKQYVDTILQSKDAVTTTQIAADYGMSAKELNRILFQEGVQHKVNGQWILYKKYMGKGLTVSRTIHFLHSDGRPDTKMNTCWTQKGRMMIHNILTGRGIVALMDREEA